MWFQLPQPRHRFLLPGCDCCDGGLTGCSICAVAPAQWQLSVSGVTSGLCTCAVWNGEFVLTNDSLVFESGNPCRWSSPVEPGAPCEAGCGDCSRWALVLGSTQAALLADENLMAAYTLPTADFDCLGPNTLTRFFGNLFCTAWPDELTITPV